MDVLHLVHCYYPARGGSEILFQQISEQLVNTYQDRVTVYTTHGYNTGFFVDPGQPAIPHTENEQLNGVQIHRFAVNNRIPPRMRKLQIRAYLNEWPLNDVLRSIYHGPISWPFLRAVASAQADVVSATSFPYLHMYYAVIGRRFNRLPLVLHGALHPDDRWSYDRRVIYKAIAACDIYLANTAFERDHVIAKGMAPDRVRIASPGVDPGPFATADGASLRHELGWADEPVVAYVGQQAAHKGIETLYQAMRPVWRTIPEARLLVAGGRTPYSEKLDALLAEFTVEERDRIRILPNFDEEEKARIYAACDIFVSASGFESFGITFLEAWSAGKPVIGCRSGAIPTVITEDQDGLLVPYQDAPELANALIRLLQDGRLREQLGQRGREKVCSNYTWEIAAQRFRAAYESAIK
ncbi:MAG: glycosyltransferase family 4 protein [Anaerolineae bacterium]|jgi:glycosyltransferase involved in cell wall biosynthesis